MKRESEKRAEHLQPSVALLVPCFNGLQHLPALLESACRMKRGFDEIIVYDDASTEAIPFSPTVEFPEIKFYRGEKNGGAGHSRNQLMELATTEYVHFHDIDDTEIPSNFLTELSPYLSANTVVFSSWKTHWFDHEPTTLYDYPDFEAITDFRGFFLKKHVHMNATIFPRNLALSVKFEEDFRTSVEDLLFNVSLAQAGAQYRHVGTVIAKHERHSSSTTIMMKRKQFQSYRARYSQRCREILPEAYHATIGEIALYHAWESCLSRFDEECELFIVAARQCGKLNCSQFGRTASGLSRLLGLSRTFKLRRWWFNRLSKGSDTSQAV